MARQIVPRSLSPLTADPSAQPSPIAGRKRKRPKGILSVACLPCQKRKIKMVPLTQPSQCDGARPACHQCASKKAEADCAYDVPEGQSRTDALKSHTSELQTRVSTSVSLLWALKMAPPDEAARILERIKSSPDPSHVLDQPAGLDLLDSTPTSEPQDPTFQPPPPSSSGTSVDTLHPSNQHRLLSSVFALLRSPATREAFRVFHQCTGLLFLVFTKAQGGAALQEVQDNDDAAISKASICEVCAMAALGAQYSQGRISSENGHYFYNVARQYLDDAIAADPLRAMKACALLAMYNILKKASVSLVYVGMPPLSHEYIS
ncbi:hypothetical protein SLS58_007639 [Diplodia intermedia]|uniref:Zn(2)-C6 fungal-type domain-containing protein n=1 Tax=Diplodia intermedia TaxID=856260 RepID=A0ABR3TJP1_9PEZI